MEELILQLQSKANITEDQAKQAINVISDYIKSKLPPMIHGMIDNFLSSPTAPTGEIDILD